ncbi:MAG: YbaK/EbsC family protein [bacterium]
MLPKKLEKFLKDHGINYDLLEHKTVYTAFDAAQTLKRKLEEIAKTLAIKADKKYALIVLPASHKADLNKLKKMLKADKLEIVKETEMAKALNVKPGAVTPFGKFHNVPVYIDKSLLKTKLIVASTGSFTESVLMKAKDLLETGAEVVGAFAKKHNFNKTRKQKSKKTSAKNVKAGAEKKSVKKKTKPAGKRDRKK